MKNIYKLFIVLGAVFLLSNCTDEFNEINTKPDSFTTEEVSAKYFLTSPQFTLYAPNRYPYWRAQLIHADRYAGQYCFGFKGSWWTDELGYAYNSAYTDAAWDWLASYIGGLDNFMRMTEPGGEFENEYMYAIGQIMRGLYFQMYTDVFGMIPYTEATNPDITLPKFDSQATIYQGIINELNAAMNTIGDAERTGANVNDVGDNDLYCNGDLQHWKKMANTFKLRIAMRAHGAPGASFAEAAILEALNAPLLETSEDNVLMEKDNTISQWSSACYGDVWYNFGVGSDWTVAKPLIDVLRNNNDPRLPIYAQPAKGGTAIIEKPDGPEAANHETRLNFILNELTEAGVEFTRTDLEDGSAEISMPENMYYVGQPVRTNDKTYPYNAYEFFSTPAEFIIAAKNSGEIRDELVMSTAEAYFLKAEAAVKGIGNAGDANTNYQEGIRQAMKLWGVSDAEI
ncbi:MAG TPA: SusD/RagB family nutrient-binding outer membrane lipoprotein, partial [Prolixibacteraceae bacterium]|nr:SusD/RagB family nutrient-binding outer membrane lipoprotein [Prolixibacteraceae bacterium]